MSYSEHYSSEYPLKLGPDKFGCWMYFGMHVMRQSHLAVPSVVPQWLRVFIDTSLCSLGVSKLAVGVGAVYVTAQQGVWNNSNDGSKALDKVKTSVLPAANEYVQKVPKVEDVNSSVLSKWNSGMQTTFDYASKLPQTAQSYGKKALKNSMDYVKNLKS